MIKAILAVLAIVAIGGEAKSQSAEEEKFYEAIDGKVDKATYNGYRRYHSACHVCHGPDGMGSSYAPALVDSLKTLDYEQFAEVVVNGRENLTGTTQSVMPAFGEVTDVMLYIDDIFAYLQGRTDGAVARGRPKRHDR